MLSVGMHVSNHTTPLTQLENMLYCTYEYKEFSLKIESIVREKRTSYMMLLLTIVKKLM